MNTEDRIAKHQAAYDRMASQLSAEQMATITAERDQLDALADDCIEHAAGMLHHMYLGEGAAADAHAREFRDWLDGLTQEQLRDIVGRLSSLVASTRYRFTGLGEA